MQSTLQFSYCTYSRTVLTGVSTYENIPRKRTDVDSTGRQLLYWHFFRSNVGYGEEHMLQREEDAKLHPLARTKLKATK